LSALLNFLVHLLANIVDMAAEHACWVTQKCTAVFDILVRSTQYGVFNFKPRDYRQFCL